MSTSRCRILRGIEVKQPVWPTFTPSQQAAAARETAPPPPLPEQTVNLDEARLEAARILREAADQAETALADARREGFEQGRREGIEAGKAEAEALRREAEAELEKARLQAEQIRQTAEADARIVRLEAEKEAQAILAAAREEARQIIEEGRREVQRRLDESRDALVDLAVAAAVRLVQGHLALQPQSIVAMVTAGLRRLKDTDCTVRVHPDDLPLLELQRATLERELGAGALQLSADPGLQRGGYVIQSNQGQIDGTLERQAERIQAALQAALGGKGS